MSNFYCCVMFPYPSGAGLHLGHYYNYAIIDSYCRWLRYKGNNVFQPFGYDAFGLPAENYAKQIGGDPKTVTLDNINCFRHQLVRMNTEYSEQLLTCDDSYVKWTQWLFLKLLEKGLAYKAIGNVNYCNSCVTVLANEQVVGNVCYRCGASIVVKSLNQWYFKITDYKERLTKNLDYVDMPESTKKQQRIWLANLTDWCVSRQRKWGCPIPIDGETDTLDTFVDSSFYYIRYLDANNEKELVSPDKYKQVDLYVGGNEHACMHLIYARFINMFLFDIGIVSSEEPFKKVIHQGMITCNGSKMGKSKGNAISPDNYNSDELRMYLMFIGHYFDGGDWSDSNILGVRRFLNRMKLWLSSNGNEELTDLSEFEDKINSLVLLFKFNKVVSEFMTYYNKNKNKSINLPSSNQLRRMLKIFAPGFETY